MPRPIADARRKRGHRILVWAELISSRPENAWNDWVAVTWNPEKEDWELSPYLEDTRIDSPITIFEPLPESPFPPVPYEDVPEDAEELERDQRNVGC